MKTDKHVDMWTMRLMREMQQLVTAAALECRSSLYGPLSLHFLDGKWTMDGLPYHGQDNSHLAMLKWLNECGRRWAVVLVSLHAIESSEKQWDHQIAVVVDLELDCATVLTPMVAEASLITRSTVKQHSVCSCLRCLSVEQVNYCFLTGNWNGLSHFRNELMPTIGNIGMRGCKPGWTMGMLCTRFGAIVGPVAIAQCLRIRMTFR